MHGRHTIARGRRGALGLPAVTSAEAVLFDVAAALADAAGGAVGEAVVVGRDVDLRAHAGETPLKT